MGHAIICQGDNQRISEQHLAVEIDSGDASADAVRILDCDFITGGVVAEDDLEMAPGLRDAWIDNQRRAPDTKAEYPFETGPIHPAGRPAVPGPSATAHVRWLGIDIATGNVRLNFVAMN